MKISDFKIKLCCNALVKLHEKKKFSLMWYEIISCENGFFLEEEDPVTGEDSLCFGNLKYCPFCGKKIEVKKIEKIRI